MRGGKYKEITVELNRCTMRFRTTAFLRAHLTASADAVVANEFIRKRIFRIPFPFFVKWISELQRMEASCL